MECSSARIAVWAELLASGLTAGAACGIGTGRRSASAGMSCRPPSCLITRPGNMSVLPKWLRRGTPTIPRHPMIMGPTFSSVFRRPARSPAPARSSARARALPLASLRPCRSRAGLRPHPSSPERSARVPEHPSKDPTESPDTLALLRLFPRIPRLRITFPT
ncbi:hypothetical protein CRG98_006191 [Punica granatum]|uniref:Secreted protein n=1 Tax=Punica granatum TaxID=22663 RepID=A0A2I0KY67_PUNGR|nr:hypothetical protein CRG98_006191 [Punica granatum]